MERTTDGEDGMVALLAKLPQVVVTEVDLDVTKDPWWQLDRLLSELQQRRAEAVERKFWEDLSKAVYGDRR